MTSALLARALQRERDLVRINRLSAHLARAIYRETRALNLPRAPLYTPGETHNALAKHLPMNALGKQGGYCFTHYEARKAPKPARKRTTCKTCPHCGYSLSGVAV